MADSSKKTREATRLRNLVIRRMGNARVPIQIDPQTSRELGPNHAQVLSYLRILTRPKVSILAPDWDHVTKVEKNLILKDICVSYLFKGY